MSGRGGRRGVITDIGGTVGWGFAVDGLAQSFPIDASPNGTATTHANQRMWVSLFRLNATKTYTTISTQCLTTAAAATPTLCRVGLFTVSGGTATLVGASTNDTAMWSATFTLYQKTVASLAGARGQLVACASLCVTGAAAPTLSSYNTSGAMQNSLMDTLYGFRIQGSIDAQADIPASFSLSSITAANGANRVWFGLS